MHLGPKQQNNLTIMDLTDAQRALTNQGSLLGQHNQVIQIVLHNVAVLSQSMNALMRLVNPPQGVIRLRS